MSLAMLIIACIAAAQAWEEMGLVERIQTVLTLVIQACQLIFDILVLICAVPGWVGLVIAAIGWLLSLVVTWIWGSPEPPPERLTKWWDANKPEVDGGFFQRIPAEPQCLLQYTMNTTKATVGSDATLVITGDLADRSVDPRFDRLTSINVYFSVWTVAGTSVLFNAKAQSLTKPEDAERPIFPAKIGEFGTSPTAFRYDVGIEADNTAHAENGSLPAITFDKGGQMVFKVWGVIATPALPETSDKTDYSKSKTAPPWWTCTMKVVESYAGANDEAQGTAEMEFVIEKA